MGKNSVYSLQEKPTNLKSQFRISMSQVQGMMGMIGMMGMMGMTSMTGMMGMKGMMGMMGMMGVIGVSQEGWQFQLLRKVKQAGIKYKICLGFRES